MTLGARLPGTFSRIKKQIMMKLVTLLRGEIFKFLVTRQTIRRWKRDRERERERDTHTQRLTEEQKVTKA